MSSDKFIETLMSAHPLDIDIDKVVDHIESLETKLRNETIERETFQHGMRQAERRNAELERQNAELERELKKAQGWINAVLERAATQPQQGEK